MSHNHEVRFPSLFSNYCSFLLLLHVTCRSVKLSTSPVRRVIIGFLHNACRIQREIGSKGESDKLFFSKNTVVYISLNNIARK